MDPKGRVLTQNWQLWVTQKIPEQILVWMRQHNELSLHDRCLLAHAPL